jgi:cation transport regulator ChaC
MPKKKTDMFVIVDGCEESGFVCPNAEYLKDQVQHLVEIGRGIEDLRVFRVAEEIEIVSKVSWELKGL